MDQVKKISKELDIPDIAVEIWTFNIDAHHFFQCKGFDIYSFRMWNIQRHAEPMRGANGVQIAGFT